MAQLGADSHGLAGLQVHPNANDQIGVGSLLCEQMVVHRRFLSSRLGWSLLHLAAPVA
jgi:hypothetical protein